MTQRLSTKTLELMEKYCIYAKVYGERNTGTNYLQNLLQTNFAVHCLQSNNPVHEYARIVGRELPKKDRGPLRSAIVDLDSRRTMLSDFGWKHGAPPIEEIRCATHARHTLFVCVAKHPAAWLRSLAQRPYNPIQPVPDDFSEFIRHSWQLTTRDNLPEYDCIEVVDLWNMKNAAFQKLRSVAAKCLVIPYEALLQDPARFLQQVSAHLVSKRDEHVWSLPSTKGDGMTFEQYREKYKTETVCRSISKEDLLFMAGRVHLPTMREFGYSWPAI
jgi:hypothetical protein